MKSIYARKSSLMRFIEREPFRFLLAGSINTGISYLVYLVFLGPLGYHLSFSLAFVVGTLIGYQLNARYVFRTATSIKKMLQYPLLYIAQYFVGLAFIAALVELGGIGETIAPLINIMLMIPLTFLLNRWLLLGKARP